MNASDWINLGLFTFLLKFKTARYAAGTILAGYLVYFTAIEPLSGDYYYHATALVNLIIGLVLFSRYKIVALLSFSLIIVSNVGNMLYQTGYPPTLYNNMSLGVILIQILLLYVRALTDGHIIRGTRGRAMVWLVNLDSFQSRFKVASRKKGAN